LLVLIPIGWRGHQPWTNTNRLARTPTLDKIAWQGHQPWAKGRLLVLILILIGWQGYQPWDSLQKNSLARTPTLGQRKATGSNTNTNRLAGIPTLGQSSKK
jgi:hypothetical protein